MKLGDILVAKFGYNCTLVDFYKVIKKTPKMVTIQKIGSKIVLSGILDEKQQVVIDAFEKNNLKLIEKMQQKEWVAFVVERED